MLNAGEAQDAPAAGGVIAYADASVASSMASGRMNTDEATLLEHVRFSSRLGYPQMRTWPVRADRVCLVGSGPSLTDTLPALRQAVWEGAKLVTLNGAYHWCIDHNLKPDTQIVMDARASNVRFVQPDVPGCRYVLASQCAPETWAAVAGRPDVWIWHGVVRADDAITEFLDSYYAKNWFGVGGGTTVATRALTLLRMAGYVRFELFGVDCCWLGGAHHALAQPENDRDGAMTVQVEGREFHVAAWHLKQFEDFCAVLKLNGQHFALTVHGEGLLAYVLRTLGSDADRAVVRPYLSPTVSEE